MVCAHPEKYPKSPFEELFGVKPHVAHFQPWGCIAFSLIHVKPKNHTKRGDMCVFVGYNDRYHVGYRLYSLTKKDFIITNDATFVLTSALNSSVINKPMSEREVNKIYSELTTTVGALATSGSVSYTHLTLPTIYSV